MSEIDFSKYCVITCHGFTGYPSEMDLLGKSIKENGFTWLNLQLPGHNTNPQDLREKTWIDWVEYVRNEVRACLLKYDEVFFTGLSLGGVMTLFVLENFPKVKAGATMSAPMQIFNPLQKLLIKLPFVGFWVKRSDDDIRDINDNTQREHHQAYLTFHTDSAKEVDKLVQNVRLNLAKITQPIIVVHSLKDKMVTPDNANIIFSNVSSEIKSKLIVENSGHVLTRDIDRSLIFEEIITHFKSQISIN